MNIDKFIKVLFSIILMGIGIICLFNLMFSKYSIFNYFNKKNESIELSKKLDTKLNERKKLLIEVNILKDKNIINIDTIEKEVIKKLNKIPFGYKIVSE